MEAVAGIALLYVILFLLYWGGTAYIRVDRERTMPRKKGFRFFFFLFIVGIIIFVAWFIYETPSKMTAVGLLGLAYFIVFAIFWIASSLQRRVKKCPYKRGDWFNAFAILFIISIAVMIAGLIKSLPDNYATSMPTVSLEDSANPYAGKYDNETLLKDIRKDAVNAFYNKPYTKDNKFDKSLNKSIARILKQNNIPDSMAQNFTSCINYEIWLKPENDKFAEPLKTCVSDYSNGIMSKIKYLNPTYAMANFNKLDGSNIALINYVKAHMNAPKSFTHLNTSYQIENNSNEKGVFIKMAYKQVNVLNATITSNIYAKIDAKGKITVLSKN
ncbi:hypothetical protein BKH43_04160 [Helicobacter sp. 13S00401-1]|uniref:hypothetical protein n=1 Tax=Helicobacter sp. 13S00401-1 TaxID=1905758 RepID=UPI000BA72855|nr:hypothetical protein [Helicobacter sp. 13S00401-1]PAF50757.1 hypothetical protein BKH43_04160 [Helicobacter sp. 13S00401-1]